MGARGGAGGGGIENKLEKSAAAEEEEEEGEEEKEEEKNRKKKPRAVITRCQFINVCVVSIIVKRPVLPPCVVDGRSRNPLYYYYYTVRKVPLGPYNTPKRRQIILSSWILAFPQQH